MVDGAVNPLVQKALDRAARNRSEKGIITDMERILAIPEVGVSSRTPAQLARLVERWTNALRRAPDAPRLREKQAHALDELAKASMGGTPRGALLGLGVGHGKTLISMMAAEVCMAVRPLLLLPPPMRDQFSRDLVAWSPYYRFTAPRVMAYSELSRPNATDFLDSFRPDLIIADEAHALRDVTSARTKRVIRYFREHPGTRFVAMSGTITKKSLLDFAHLMELCLREWTPLPLDRTALELWASVVDSGGEPDSKAWDAIWPLVIRNRGPEDWRDIKGHTADQERMITARVAFRTRLENTPGVVVTYDSSATSTLYMVPRHVSVPADVAATLHRLETKWELPAAGQEGAPGDEGQEGEPITDALAIARAGGQISAGYYYVWDWPGGTPDKEWLEARRAWNKAVRGVLRFSSRSGLDSPLLVQQWVEAGHGGAETRWAWKEWCKHRHKEKPPTRAIWVSPFLVQDVVKWVEDHRKKNRPAILWYYSHAMENALKSKGIPVFGQGSDISNATIKVHPIVACSIPVHGKGKNLQAWNRMLVIEPPSSGDVWEQLLGRELRQGQLADWVLVTVMQHTGRVRAAVSKATMDALYIEQTQGNPQLLNAATWVPTEEEVEELAD